MAKRLTVREVAERTGAAISTVGNWCRAGKFPNASKESTPFGDFWTIPEEDVTKAKIEVKMGRPRKV